MTFLQPSDIVVLEGAEFKPNGVKDTNPGGHPFLVLETNGDFAYCVCLTSTDHMPAAEKLCNPVSIPGKRDREKCYFISDVIYKFYLSERNPLSNISGSSYCKVINIIYKNFKQRQMIEDVACLEAVCLFDVEYLTSRSKRDPLLGVPLIMENDCEKSDQYSKVYGSYSG